MQNNWAKWLSMMKFSENFNIFLIISMISFYFNKEFHSWMNFNSDTTDYKITCKRLEVRKVNDIIIWMKEFLIFDHQQLKKTKQIIEAQMNKHKRDIIYKVNNWVWLFFRNIKTTRKVFASNWESQLIYSQSIILRSMINQNESIKTLNANLESTAITCRMIELNEYLW